MGCVPNELVTTILMNEVTDRGQHGWCLSVDLSFRSVHGGSVGSRGGGGEAYSTCNTALQKINCCIRAHRAARIITPPCADNNSFVHASYRIQFHEENMALLYL